MAGAGLPSLLAAGLASAGVAATPPGVKGRVVVTGAPTSADAVVSLSAPGLKLAPPVEPMTVDQRGLRFKPHVLAVQAGTTVRFLNNDPEPHNVYSPEGRYNLGSWSAGESRDRLFAEPGAFSQLCGLHPDMLAYVVVLDTPYFAVTDAAGSFSIPGVPPGRYTLVVWHERKQELRRPVTVEQGRPLALELTLER